MVHGRGVEVNVSKLENLDATGAIGTLRKMIH